MITAIICEYGKEIIVQDIKYLTVKDIHENMRKKFGRPLLNSHYAKNNKLVVNWQFPKASVRLEGDTDIHVGYRTKKGNK